MIIANPIYDVIFKRLLENDRVAKFFIGTILDCKVTSLTPTVIERTKRDEDSGKLTLFRMDFAATIMNGNGEEKRVLIEMQKAKHLADVARFREYLGTEYIASTLPIISIYILGFNLSVDSVAFGNFPICRDLRTGKQLNPHDPFVEQLTHTAYFVQTKRITPSLNTRLDKLLSIFEQANFISGSQTTKDYALNVDDPELKETLDILRYAAADSKTRKVLDEEEYYQKAMYGMFGEQYEKMEKQAQELAAAKRETEDAKRETEDAKREIEETKREIEETKHNVVHELRKKGMSTPEIARIVNLTEAEVEKLITESA
jgi:uncharacterized tellurite resistance protein B-like protein